MLQSERNSSDFDFFGMLWATGSWDVILFLLGSGLQHSVISIFTSWLLASNNFPLAMSSSSSRKSVFVLLWTSEPRSVLSLKLSVANSPLRSFEMSRIFSARATVIHMRQERRVDSSWAQSEEDKCDSHERREWLHWLACLACI